MKRKTLMTSERIDLGALVKAYSSPVLREGERVSGSAGCSRYHRRELLT